MARPKIQLDQYAVMGRKQMSRGEDKSKTSGYETLCVLNCCHCVPSVAQREREAIKRFCMLELTCVAAKLCGLLSSVEQASAWSDMTEQQGPCYLSPVLIPPP